MEKLNSIWQIDEIMINEIRNRSRTSTYSKELCRLLDSYRNLLRNYLIYDYPLYDYGNIKERVYKNILDLKKLFRSYESGDLIQTDKITNRLFKLTGRSVPKSTYFPISIIPSQSIFYRAGTWEANKREDLFHAPFHLRRKIGSNRFSLPGYPCLYLSSSIACAFDEVRKNRSKVYVSAFKNLKELKMYDFRFFPDGDDKDKTKNIIDNVLSYPFKIAASIPLLDDKKDDVYKEEYIIPQILLHSVIRQKTGKDIVGILYTSTMAITNNLPVCEYSKYQNLVLPAHFFKEKGYCSFLKRLFSLTVPTEVAGFHTTEWASLENDICSKDFGMIEL